MKKTELERAVTDRDEEYWKRLARVSIKVINLMAKKLKNPLDCYFLLKFLCVSFEYDFGFFMTPEGESMLREMMNLESQNHKG